MKIPVVRGIIDRRILVNYRADPEIVAAMLPAPFRPKIYRGYAMVGICLIRLRHVRPHFLPAWLGIGSENAAHRTAVEWDDDRVVSEGVFVRRRDTSSWLNTITGGRIFPGFHHHARCTVKETPKHFEVALASDDGATNVSVVADLAEWLPEDSIFESLAEASAFFEAGSLGYSATPRAGTFQGLELRCHRWKAEPLRVTSVRSTVFDDRTVFPAGSIAFDCALLMRGIEHEWHGKADLCCDGRYTLNRQCSHHAGYPLGG
jgi:hypothetical protein